MSFNSFKTVIEEGDTVILFISVHQKHPVKASFKTVNKKGQAIDNVFQTVYGSVKCGELIGKPYGSKLHLSKGFIYILQPSPELWTLCLPHRTQIVYTPDISMILLQLEINPGSIVIESGTGSASLSHALIRTIKPHGHLHTFDFHAERVQSAIDEFRDHGLESFVNVMQRDVCADGFGVELDGKADAVFLDLPHPWLAIPYAVNAFKNGGGRICSFSPCMEQVQKSCAKLKELGFIEIETLELLQTKYVIQKREISSLDLQFLKTARKEDDGEEEKAQKEKNGKTSSKILVACPPDSQAGHTGYLSFATLPPKMNRLNSVIF